MDGMVPAEKYKQKESSSSLLSFNNLPSTQVILTYINNHIDNTSVGSIPQILFSKIMRVFIGA
jgi:hypothetical protein